jgi:hypothetical protein
MDLMIKHRNFLEFGFDSIMKNKKVLLIFIIVAVLAIKNLQHIRTAMFIIIFILLSGISKLYHQFFKSSIGIDLVFFTTVMTVLVYHNSALGLIVAWPGLIIADIAGKRFSYTSLVSLIALTIVALTGGFLIFPITLSAFILIIIYETVSILFYYYVLGSSIEKIGIFLLSHFVFNAFLVLTFADSLSSLMV